MIEILQENGEYVAWSDDCLLCAFGSSPEEARAELLGRAHRDYGYLQELLARQRLSEHLAATIPHIKTLLEVAGDLAPD